jgi:hypothetical protein
MAPAAARGGKLPPIQRTQVTQPPQSTAIATPPIPKNDTRGTLLSPPEERKDVLEGATQKKKKKPGAGAGPNANIGEYDDDDSDEDVTVRPTPGGSNNNSRSYVLALKPLNEAAGKPFSLSTAKPLQVGRIASNCEIYINDEEVSRKHATIFFSEGKYFIKDEGSSSGTFVKEKKTKLNKGALCEIGRLMFEVLDIFNDGVKFKILEATDDYTGRVFTAKNGEKIGRKIGNDYTFPDDNLMSSNHAIFEISSNGAYIIDTNSSNG